MKRKTLQIADTKRRPIPWESLMELAAKDNRTVSEYACLVLINHVKEVKNEADNVNVC